MSYFIDLFTIETYEAFLQSDRKVSGFRETQHSMAARVHPGDILLGYVKGLSRWSTSKSVIEGPFLDRSPLFLPENDPFVVRFRVEPMVCLPLEYSLPIKDERIFGRLSFTRGNENGYWLGPLRRSLQHIDDDDGRFLESLLAEQQEKRELFPLEDIELDEYRHQHIKRADGSVSVTVPRDDATELTDGKSNRESVRVQADLAKLGQAMGFRIWVPKADRQSILAHWSPQAGILLESLPLNYDDTTLKTIEQIDVLWLKGRAIQRAFEVEHSTAVYSGLLRMADLLALQPNMNISLHIVAPFERRDKVLREIRRPVFSLIENQPLAERCSFLPYESLRDVIALPHLSHLSDSVLQEYEEWAE